MDQLWLQLRVSETSYSAEQRAGTVGVVMAMRLGILGWRWVFSDSDGYFGLAMLSAVLGWRWVFWVGDAVGYLRMAMGCWMGWGGDTVGVL